MRCGRHVGEPGAGLLGIVGAFLARPAAAAVELVVTEVTWPKLEQS